jgi:type 1 glutamine amidotransferase
MKPGITRRTILKAGLTTATGVAGLAAGANPLLAQPRQPGETRVIYLGGDYWHNAMMQEVRFREVLSPAGWRLMFTQSSQFLTPEAIADTDLLILCRYSGRDTVGWAPDRMVEIRPQGSPFMTDEQEDAIVDNVMNRGMGLMSIHCTVWNGERKKFMKLIGVEKPYMHTPVQPTLMHKFNENHVITQGLEEAKFVDDEIFSADLTSDAQVLYNLRGEEFPQDKAGGWVTEMGKGRTVTLLPGHTPHPYHTYSHKETIWRGAHWAMHRDFPESSFIHGR